MRFQRLKVLLIVIFVAVVLKCVAASPALSQLLMDTVNEEGEETRSPPPWAQANGHGIHFTNRLFFVKRIMFDYTVDILVSSFVQKEVFFLRKTTDNFRFSSCIHNRERKSTLAKTHYDSIKFVKLIPEIRVVSKMKIGNIK